MQCGVLSCDPCPWACWACRVRKSVHGDPFGGVFGSADTSQRVPNTCTGPDSPARVWCVCGAGHAHPVWRIKYIVEFQGVPMPMPSGARALRCCAHCRGCGCAARSQRGVIYSQTRICRRFEGLEVALGVLMEEYFFHNFGRGSDATS